MIDKFGCNITSVIVTGYPNRTVAPRVARCPVFDQTVRFFGDLSGQKYDAKPDN